MKPVPFLLALVLPGFSVLPAQAHFNMLLPERPSVKKDEGTTITYQWGHPFEHQLFDAPAPESLTVVRPDGKTADLTSALEKIAVPAGEGKQVTAYRLPFTPQQRGDHVFILQTPPIWMEEDEEFLRDTVTVVLHVQAQKGWDAATSRFQLVPLTRPYGLWPGMVFQAQAAGTERPLARAPVEIERYNPAPPGELPADEHVTYAARTDPNGIVTCTLPDPGWWSITVTRDAAMRERDGKKYPLRERATLWVFVDEKK
jgi:cobalt/nickel transport protein